MTGAPTYRTAGSKKLKAVEAALAAYRETGARELPSVAGPKSRGVPRSFLKAVDDLVAAVEEATR